jgi:hypothetical protein
LNCEGSGMADLQFHIQICNARAFRLFVFAYFFRAHC